MKRARKIYGLTVLTVFFVLTAALSVFAADSSKVSVSVTYGQTEARKMLDMINDWRTGDDAWAYDSNNNKVTYSDLGKLTYDYGLEKVAMQRAVEAALFFAHTRTDNTSCWTAFPSSYYGASGENIAAGTSTASYTFEMWQETNEDYSGQGHRRNMLSSYSKYIGIGHVVYNGIHFWTQEFGSTALSTTSTTANDSAASASVTIAHDLVSDSSMTVNGGSAVSLEYKSSVTLAVAGKGSLESNAGYTWPSGTKPVTPTGLTWSIGDSSVISIKNGSITGLKVGSTTISTEFLGSTRSFTVTVTPIDLSSASVTAADQTYSGAALTPAPTVTMNSTVLKSGTDYTASYSNNIDAGTATVTITGKGNYTGTATKNFTINQKPIDGARIASISDQTYTGSAITANPAVTLEGKTLVNGTDYTLSFSNNTNAGTATVTATGKGNYKGMVSSTFTILKKTLTAAMVDTADEQYTESAITKTVTDGSRTLAEGTDYTATYKNNVEAGTAEVTVTGNGNYTGTVKATFKILQRTLTAAMVNSADEQYTGAAITKAVTYGAKTLSEGTDYEVTYSNNVGPGTATVTVTGKGNYSGTVTVSFQIVKPASATNSTGQTTGTIAAAAAAVSENGDMAGSAFSALQLKMKKAKKTSISIKWTPQSGAAGYIVFGAQCGSKYTEIARTGSASYTQTGLKKAKYYKYFVAAYDSAGNITAISKTVHIATKGGKVDNYKRVKVSKKSVTLKQGKSKKVKATGVKPSGKKVKKHRKITFESSDTAIVTVTSSGKITAVGKGSCVVYAYDQTGRATKIKVKVK